MSQKKAVSVPDGKGGWVAQDMDVVTGAKADPSKAAQAQAKAFADEAAQLTERILQFDRIYLRERALTKEHRVFAAALYCVSLRESYPDGPDAFDAIAADAAAYFDKNKDKL